MSILKYSLLTVLIILVLAMVLVGILSLTRGATVRTVIAEGDRGGPPQVSDPLFPHSIELFTGTHIEPGNRVEILLNGEGTYPLLWKDIASAKKTVMWLPCPSTADGEKSSTTARTRSPSAPETSSAG